MLKSELSQRQTCLCSRSRSLSHSSSIIIRLGFHQLCLSLSFKFSCSPCPTDLFNLQRGSAVQKNAPHAACTAEYERVSAGWSGACRWEGLLTWVRGWKQRPIALCWRNTRPYWRLLKLYWNCLRLFCVSDPVRSGAEICEAAVAQFCQRVSLLWNPIASFSNLHISTWVARIVYDAIFEYFTGQSCSHGSSWNIRTLIFLWCK